MDLPRPPIITLIRPKYIRGILPSMPFDVKPAEERKPTFSVSLMDAI